MQRRRVLVYAPSMLGDASSRATHWFSLQLSGGCIIAAMHTTFPHSQHCGASLTCNATLGSGSSITFSAAVYCVTLMSVGTRRVGEQ